MEDIRIILRQDEGMIDVLQNGYNIIAETIYNEELTNKILELIENELKDNGNDFDSLDKFLTMKQEKAKCKTNTKLLEDKE